MSNGSYWDTPGAKAAAAAQSASTAEDYWSAPGVKDAQVSSTKLAASLLFDYYLHNQLKDKLSRTPHVPGQGMISGGGGITGGTPESELDVLQSNVDAQMRKVTVAGFYIDPVPSYYRRMSHIVKDLGHTWKLLIRSPDHSPNKFLTHCVVCWYFDRHADPWCCEWDVTLVQQAIRKYGVR